MSSNQQKGGCLCGAIEFEVTLNEKDVHVCHCGICQKWGGSSSLSLQCDGDWNIKGEESLSWYDSSEFAQRGFCQKCGTHMLFRMNDKSYYGVTAGSLESNEGFKLDMHIFIDKKPDYYDFKDECTRLTEDEFLKMVGAE
jgi:hypothetical protein